MDDNYIHDFMCGMWLFIHAITYHAEVTTWMSDNIR